MSTQALCRGIALALAVALAVPFAAGAERKKKKRPYRLKSVNIRQRLLWGAECRRPGGTGLAFGGQDQQSHDGRPHTRILIDGKWKAIHGHLRSRNPLQSFHDRAASLRSDVKDARAKARLLYFKGLPAEAEARRAAEELIPRQQKVARELKALTADLAKPTARGDYEKGQAAFALKHLRAAAGLVGPLPARVTPAAIQTMRRAEVHLDLAAEALDAEPPARALSPIVYDGKAKLYVIFGGDHLDYLTCDTWVFDPAAAKWFQRHPKAAPAPRAKHVLTAAGDGRIKLAGGYTYASNTDYCGGQYVDLDDGEHVYDIEADAWRGAGLVAADSRVYRTGPFHPDFYLRGEAPDAAAFEAKLKELPTNEWVATNPPHRPRLNRDWGTAVIDTHRDMILRWSGGHSAHGGTDVPHFHFSTNRWELAYPVEFPLGQLYSNTSYPAGFNFNLRPGMTGHTYQNYAFDPVSKTMVQTGHYRNFYIYDPDAADWVGRAEKPKGMQYNSCFYTLTLCATPRGAVCWTKNGEFYLYDSAGKTWSRIKTRGDRPPRAVVDNSTIAYDAKRDRLLLFAKPYGKAPYDGQVHALDMKTGAVKALSPAGAETAPTIAWIDRCCYDGQNDLVLMATYLKPSKQWTPTPAYHCASNRWVLLRIKYALKKHWGGPRRLLPHGHSAGVMYDPKRKLIWGTDTNSQVYVLKLDAEAAGRQPLR